MKQFMTPELELIRLDVVDVITASGIVTVPGSSTTVPAAISSVASSSSAVATTAVAATTAAAASSAIAATTAAAGSSASGSSAAGSSAAATSAAASSSAPIPTVTDDGLDNEVSADRWMF